MSMHFKALRSLTQPCFGCTLHHNISMMQAVYRAVQISASLVKYIRDPVYQGDC